MAEDEQQASGEGSGDGGGDDAVQKKGEKVDAAPGQSNQKLVFIFLALNSVILIVIAALFVMQYTKKSKEVSLADVHTSKEGAHAEVKGDDGHGGGKSGDKKGEDVANRFIKETFTVNLKDSKGAHYAKVNVEIEVDDDFVREEVKKLTPRIRDFIVVTLSSKTYEQVESVDGREFLREDIRNKINGYLTRGQIKNVYFTEFIIQ